MARRPAHAASRGADKGRAREQGEPRCRSCEAPVRVTWHVPSSCKKCGTSFVARPRWTVSVAFVVATVVAVVTMALVRLVLVQLELNLTGLMVVAGMALGVVGFNLVEVVMFRTGVMRLTGVNAPDEGLGVALSPTDEDALAKAERLVRQRNYAGTSRDERAAQAQQLRESLRIARSIRGGEPAREGEPARDGEARPASAAQTPAESSAAPTVELRGTGEGRCRFRSVDVANEAAVRRLEEFGATVADGTEYHLVYPPREATSPAEGTRRRVRAIGYVATSPQASGTLRIDGFYLLPEERGQGYARSMMLLVAQLAHKAGCRRATAEVGHNDYAAMLALEHLGFELAEEHPPTLTYAIAL